MGHSWEVTFEHINAHGSARAFHLGAYARDAQIPYDMPCIRARLAV